jgi:hypothetical protein
MDELKKEYTIKSFTFPVTAEGSFTSQEFQFENIIDKVVSFQVTSSPEKKFVHYKGAIGMTINSLEIYPDNIPAELFVAGSQCPPSQRWTVLKDNPDGFEAQNGLLKIRYKDTANPNAVFPVGGYVVTVLFKCTLK